MRKRGQDWGREGLDQRFAEAWQRFAPMAAKSLELRVGTGSEGLTSAWQRVLTGKAPAREGNVIQLNPDEA